MMIDILELIQIKKKFFIFLIHQDTILPKKLIIILSLFIQKKTISFKNLSFFISYLVKKLSLVKFSIKKFFYVTFLL